MTICVSLHFKCLKAITKVVHSGKLLPCYNKSVLTAFRSIVKCICLYFQALQEGLLLNFDMCCVSIIFVYKFSWDPAEGWCNKVHPGAATRLFTSSVFVFSEAVTVDL